MDTLRKACVGVLLGCLAGLVIAGCGAGSDESKASDEPTILSKAQYVKQADAICQKANGEQEILGQQAQEKVPPGGTASKSEQEAYVLNAMGPLKKSAVALDELGVPRGEEEKAEAFVDALRKGIRGIEADPLAYNEGKSQPYAPVERLGEELSLAVCLYP